MKIHGGFRSWLWVVLLVDIVALCGGSDFDPQSLPFQASGGSKECWLSASEEVKVLVVPWGADSLRVRIPLDGGTAIHSDLPSPYVTPPGSKRKVSKNEWHTLEDSLTYSDDFSCSLHSTVTGQAERKHTSPQVSNSSVTNGNLRADIGVDGMLTFTRISDGKIVLQEASRAIKPSNVTGMMSLEHTFHSSSDEQVFGFGEHQNGHLNQKGLEYVFHDCVDYSISHGGAICLPVVVGVHHDWQQKHKDSTHSNNTKNVAPAPCLDYGMLWSMPGYGSVSFNDNETVWRAIATRQLDFFVTVAHNGSRGAQCNADISSHYVDATGHSPLLPRWASGYWHSRNRYKTQAEILAAAKQFHDRDIPVDIIVIDYKHWKYMGDWSFDPKSWPNPTAMEQTLSGYGMRTMVSVWPYSMVQSTSFETINSSNFEAMNGTSDVGIWWPNSVCKGKCYLYDPTQPAARQYVWSRVDKGYTPHGIHLFWLDSTEPPTHGPTPVGTHFEVGYAEQMGMSFPFFHCQTVYNGLLSLGQPPLMLLRSAWAGQQRFGTVLWSGDTQSTFETLQKSIAAGLNLQLAGIAWWTTDIGGYSNGRPGQPEFDELIVRWFQYGSTCPIFRQHGQRPTEPWLLSNASYKLVVEVIKMRKLWESYVMDAMKQVNVTGRPIQRPLWYDFPEDAAAWHVEDQYMFGSEAMVAPVYTYGALNRTVYFPQGTSWRNYFTGEHIEGGQRVTIGAPLNEFPLYTRQTGAAWPSNVPLPPRGGKL